MHVLRAAAVAVVLSTAVIAGAALLGDAVVAGTARPMDERSLLATCEYDQLDVDGTKVCEYTYFGLPRSSGFTGAGCAAPDVARFEVVVLDGPPIEIVPENGLFAYTASNDLDDIVPVDALILRAYDKDGTLLQEK